MTERVTPLPGEVPDRPVSTSDPAAPPAYYARRGGLLRDWWNLLHPPYTAWHLAYVVIGAALAPRVAVSTLLATLLAFFLAVGVAAHALDELRGRPLRTTIRAGVLIGAAVIGLVGAIAVGIVGTARVGWPLVPLLVVGPVAVVGYNLELWGGRLHNALTFASAWGAFPVLTAYVAQTGTLRAAPVLAAGGALALSLAQRSLSTPARYLRRRVAAIDGVLCLSDGELVPLDRSMLLAPIERALRAMSWAIVLTAAAMAVAAIR
jgi:hypothetical protein